MLAQQLVTLLNHVHCLSESRGSGEAIQEMEPRRSGAVDRVNLGSSSDKPFMTLLSLHWLSACMCGWQLIVSAGSRLSRAMQNSSDVSMATG